METRRRAVNARPQSANSPIPSPRPQYQSVAAIAIDAVTPSERGFTLTGRGAPPDGGLYRLELRFELPLDPRTRAVLGELLSQSDLTVSRRDTAPRNS